MICLQCVVAVGRATSWASCHLVH